MLNDLRPFGHVLRSDARLMIGHRGGLRESQAIGDYVLAQRLLTR